MDLSWTQRNVHLKALLYSKISGVLCYDFYFRHKTLLDKFQKDVIEKVADANALQPKYEQPKTSRLKVAKCRPSRGSCADKKDKHNHNKPAESSDSRLVFDQVF